MVVGIIFAGAAVSLTAGLGFLPALAPDFPGAACSSTTAGS
jgi:hypothetical protein